MSRIATPAAESLGDAKSAGPASRSDYTTNCLFEEDWWLDAVAPGSWRTLDVHVGGTLQARMPIFVTRTFGLASIRQPPFTQTLGPWYRTGLGKYCARLGREKDLAEELISKLPPHHFFSVNFHHGVTNWLPFLWKGFEAAPLVTYVLPDIADEAEIWNGIQDKTRSEIRKAQKQVEIVVLDDIDKFIEVHAKTFARQGLALPHSEDAIRRLDSACATRQARRIFFAIDERQRVHAAVYLVWDERCAYYLLGGGDPELRQSGAGSLLVWEAIRHARQVSRSFDFEGAMGETRERFFRSFGPRQTTYLNVRRASRPVAFALGLRRALQSLRKA